MIVPSPRNTRRRALAVLAAAAALTLGLGIASPVAAAESTPSPTPTASPQPGTTTFTLAPIRNGIVRAGEGLTASVGIENTTDAATAPTTVTLSLGRQPLANRGALTSWLAGVVDGIETEAVGSTLLESVAPGGQEFTGVMVAADAPALAGLGPGVYPLLASYDSATGVVHATSAFVVPRDDVQAAVSVVVPITVAARSEALLTADELIELMGPGGSLTDQLDAVEGSSTILAIDPAIPAAVRALGISAPPVATAWLEWLAQLPNARFALQFGDADPAVQIEAGARPATVTPLTAFLRPADFPPAPATEADGAPSPTPTPSTDPLAPTFPTLVELLDIGSSRPGVYWPSADAVTPGAVDGLGGITTDDESSLTIVPSTSTVAGASGATVAARAITGQANLLVADADVSRTLSAAAGQNEGPLRGASLAAASAYLSFAAGEVGGGTVLAALDRSAAVSNVSLRAAIEAATEYPDLSPQSLTSLAASAPRTVQIADAAPPVARVAEASSLFAEEAELGRFATILDDPNLLAGPERAEILQLLGVAWVREPAAWTAAVAAHHEATAETLTSVQLVPTSTINLFGSGAALRFTVRNALPYPVNLVLYATPDDLRLDVQRASPVVATATSNTRVEVPVQARIGNGEVTLTLQLRSRASVAIGPAETVDVNVRAEWETVGIVALSIIVGGLVVLGVVRTVLRARSRTRAKADAAAAAEGNDP